MYPINQLKSLEFIFSWAYFLPSDKMQIRYKDLKFSIVALGHRFRPKVGVLLYLGDFLFLCTLEAFTLRGHILTNRGKLPLLNLRYASETEKKHPSHPLILIYSKILRKGVYIDFRQAKSGKPPKNEILSNSSEAFRANYVFACS